jgi:hypothetical protein
VWGTARSPTDKYEYSLLVSVLRSQSSALRRNELTKESSPST